MERKRMKKKTCNDRAREAINIQVRDFLLRARAVTARSQRCCLLIKLHLMASSSRGYLWDTDYGQLGIKRLKMH